MRLRHCWADNGRACTAIEDIEALASWPNAWMTEAHQRLCQQFRGTEAEAKELRARIESECGGAREGWRRSL